MKTCGKCIYLDYNGTTPIYKPVLDAMMPYLTHHYGNPSSSHQYGREPKRALDHARRAVLRLVCPRGDDIDKDALMALMITSCGTESNNWAIRFALLRARDRTDGEGPLHVVTSNIEHPAIAECLKSYVEGHLTPKITVTYVEANREGIVSTQEVLDAMMPNTALVTIMTANNEVGSVQPVFDIAKQCRERGVLFHTDAAQAVGKIDLRGLADPDFGADMITLVGHKFGCPKGVAALYVRPDCFNEYKHTGSLLLMGGGQENGMRGGTENVPYIVAMGRAAEILLEKRDNSEITNLESNIVHMSRMRERLLTKLVNGIGKDEIVRVNGPSKPEQRLPNTLSVGLKGVQSGNLLAKIGDIVACSAGSACHSSNQTSYSSVLKALEVPPAYAIGTLRLSVGPDTVEEEIDFAAAAIIEEANSMINRY
mmetsp:Transcript_29731/g.70661  ORF Transcript_29731/g.70661 Transcript_29731/m.70661 type:complete len:425 (+) Transcript_29731:170-1444(+)